MLNYVRRALGALAVAALAAAVPLSASAHEFVCDGLTPGYWCGGASVLFGYKDDTAFCEGFGLPTGCGDTVCASLGFAGGCDQMCECFGDASANPNSDVLACPAPGGMAEVLQKFWTALQLSFPEILPIGGIQCNGACDGGFPDCNAQEIQDLIDCGAACREEQEVVKNCIDAALNAYPDAPLCVTAY